MRRKTVVRNKHLGGGLVSGATATAMLVAVLAFAPAAWAIEPTGDFAVFKQCPRFTTGVTLCIYAETLGGEVTLHKQTVPINGDGKHAIKLQGGIVTPEEGEGELFVGALNGETLSKTPQKVPGGLAGLVDCTAIKGSGALELLARRSCETAFENGATGVNAVTELAKPASEIIVNTAALESGEGTTLGLPVKVHLENTLLGSECYIGSSAHPLQLNFTVGTTSPAPPNKPISGKVGESEFKDELEFIHFPETVLVNNEFAAPEATGCGGLFASILTPIVNEKIGLPSPDGLNTAIERNMVDIGGVPGVVASEK